MHRDPTADESRWLAYFRDLGFEDLWLDGPPATAARRPEARESPGVAAVTPEPEAAPVAAIPEGVTAPKDATVATEDSLAAVGREAAACVACALAEGRRTVVFGSGSASAELMLIGEGPGQREDEQGLPFVGPAGELLTRMLRAIDRTRDEVYITNVVKCRPPRNRDPESTEVAACAGYLERQIDLIAPRVIVALGRVAAQSLLGSDQSLGRMRGDWHSVRGVPTRVTYHPAALLRSSSYRAPTWEDLQVVRDRLADPA